MHRCKSRRHRIPVPNAPVPRDRLLERRYLVPPARRDKLTSAFTDVAFKASRDCAKKVYEDAGMLLAQCPGDDVIPVYCRAVSAIGAPDHGGAASLSVVGRPAVYWTALSISYSQRPIVGWRETWLVVDKDAGTGGRHTTNLIRTATSRPPMMAHSRPRMSVIIMASRLATSTRAALRGPGLPGSRWAESTSS